MSSHRVELAKRLYKGKRGGKRMIDAVKNGEDVKRRALERQAMNAARRNGTPVDTEASSTSARTQSDPDKAASKKSRGDDGPFGDLWRAIQSGSTPDQTRRGETPPEEAVAELKRLVRSGGDAAAASAVWYLFQRLEESNDSHVRLWTLELLAVLFARSATARRAVVADSRRFLTLAAGVGGKLRQTGSSSEASSKAKSSSSSASLSSSSSSSSLAASDAALTLPPPPAFAAKLQLRAAGVLSTWADAFGELYPQLRIAHRYLAETLRVKAAVAAAAAAAAAADPGGAPSRKVSGAGGGTQGRKVAAERGKKKRAKDSTATTETRLSGPPPPSSPSSSSTRQSRGRMRTDPVRAHRTRVAYEKTLDEMLGKQKRQTPSKRTIAAGTRLSAAPSDRHGGDGGSGSRSNGGRLAEVETTVTELEEALRLLAPTAEDELHWRGLDVENIASGSANEHRRTARSKSKKNSSGLTSIRSDDENAKSDVDSDMDWEDGNLDDNDNSNEEGGDFADGTATEPELMFDGDDVDDDEDEEQGLGAVVDMAGLGSRRYALEIEVDLNPRCVGGGAGGEDDDDEEEQSGAHILHTTIADARRLLATRHVPALRRWRTAISLALASQNEIFFIPAEPADYQDGGSEVQQACVQGLAAADECRAIKERLRLLYLRIKDLTRRCGGKLL